MTFKDGMLIDGPFFADVYFTLQGNKFREYRVTQRKASGEWSVARMGPNPIRVDLSEELQMKLIERAKVLLAVKRLTR